MGGLPLKLDLIQRLMRPTGLTCADHRSGEVNRARVNATDGSLKGRST